MDNESEDGQSRPGRGREFEEDWLESGEGYRSCEMERGSKSNCGENEVHPATFGHEEKPD